MKTYELHGFRNGKWEIQASFEDRDEALLEARNAVGDNRFPGIRVTEELFDEASNRTRTRSIFSYEYSAALDRSGREEQKLSGLRDLRAKLRRKGRAGLAVEDDGLESPLGFIGPFLYLFFLLLLGVFALIGLRTLFSVA